MTRTETFEPRFVDQLPDDLEAGVLYVSMEFATAAHSCACGCGSRVLTPLRSNRWWMTFDGERVWLYPSIGNWNFDCKAHYWIQGNAVRWAAEMTANEIKAIRARSLRGVGDARWRRHGPNGTRVLGPANSCWRAASRELVSRTRLAVRRPQSEAPIGPTSLYWRIAGATATR